MRIAKALTPVAVAALVVAAVATAMSRPSAADKPAPEDARKLSAANNEFGFDLLKHLHADGENTFFSPTSIGMALQMTGRGAKGETLKQMNETMHVDGLDVGASNRKLLDSLSGRDDVKLRIGNAIWTDPASINLNKEFAAEIGKQFDAEVNSLSFTDPKTKDIINGWISEKTETKIPQMLEELDPSVVALLANAIYFKGDWSYRFDREKTIKADFTRVDGSTQQVDMMKSDKLKFRYTQTDDVQVVALPYGPAPAEDKPGPQPAVNMWLVVPLPGKSLDTVVENLDSKTFAAWQQKASRMEGTVELPRFKMKWRKELQNDLPKLGMVDAFGSKADFSGFEEGSVGPNGLYISKVLHEAIIEVNEEGTVAAAATVVAMQRKGVPRTFKVRCDRPFLLVIADDKTGSIMFIGTVYKPESME